MSYLVLSSNIDPYYLTNVCGVISKFEYLFFILLNNALGGFFQSLHAKLTWFLVTLYDIFRRFQIDFVIIVLPTH